MKTRPKVLSLLLVSLMLVTAMIIGTLAYLTSTDEAVNTFTVGSVSITLDEAPVDSDGQATEGQRGYQNQYKLIPGQAYDKDPIVHLAGGSEASWLFIRVRNDLSAIEETAVQDPAAGGYRNIDQQITDNGWQKLDGYQDVYFQAADANTGTAAVDYPVFQGFTINGNVTNEILATYATSYDDNQKPTDSYILITGYAVQADGFLTAADAWSNTFGKQ